MQLYIAGTFLVISLFLFLIIYIFAVRTIRERQIKLLELELETTEMEVQLFFDDFEHAIEDVTNQILHYNIDGLKDYMTLKQEHHDNIASIYYGTVDNVMYNSTDFIPPAGFDLRTRIWYQMAVQKGDIIVTPAFLNATEDYLITTIAKPVYQADILLGVIGIDIRINSIDAHLESRVIGSTGYALLIDSNNQVITNPTHWDLGSDLVDSSNIGLDLSILEENEVFINQVINKDDGTMIFTDVVLDYYTLVVFMPNGEYYQTQRQFNRFFIVIFILINVIGISFIMFNRTFIVEPLRRLDQEVA